jgi:glycosyltransferase involved in cell wall biosynthesis
MTGRRALRHLPPAPRGPDEPPDISTRQKLARKLTVVIPTRNRAVHLSVAIASVLASPLISDPRQIVVVDDDSTDVTAQVAESYDTSYIKVRCHGPSGSRNAGLAFSETPYVTFLDDDDAWLPDAMEAQTTALDRADDAAFAYGMTRLATDSLQPLDSTWPVPPLASGLVPERLYLNFPQIGAVLFRRELLANAGGFDTRMFFGEDAEVMLRLAAHHPIIGVESVTVLYRQRAPSMARADYFWNGRAIVHWRPRHVGVGWAAFANFESHTRGSFAWRFCEDAAWCAANSSRNDALVCLYRAFRISPAHTILRQRQTVWSTIRSIAATRSAQPRTVE